VRGTVRSLASEKTAALKECFQPYLPRLELLEADLKREDGWTAACEGATYMLHVACPTDTASFSADPFNKRLKPDAEIQEVIDMVCSSTRMVFEVAKAAGVKRVVLTSSAIAMIQPGIAPVWFPMSGKPGEYDPAVYAKVANEDIWMDEDTWTDETLVAGYPRAKTLSEREAWKAVEGDTMELAVINPIITIGPQLHKLLWNNAFTPVDLAMHAEICPAMPWSDFSMVDVRDVAKAHVKAMLLPQAAGQRFLLCTEGMTSWDVLPIIAETFKPMGYNVIEPKKRMSKCFAGLLGCWDPFMHRIYLNWNSPIKARNTKWKRDLVPHPIDGRTSCLDTAFSAVKTGRYARKPGFHSDRPEYQGSAGFISLKASLA